MLELNLRDRARRRGFTLVEVLVVIGILALLISILLPSLTKARESANRVKCAANLHNLGLACIQFANERGGVFPVSYQMPTSGFPYRLPTILSRNEALEDDPAQWKTYGTPWQTFQAYGMLQNNWKCPSATGNVRVLGSAEGTPAEWGDIVWTNYMYVAGLNTTNLGKSAYKWGPYAMPAERNNEADGSQKVLAADTVFYSGGAGYLWDLVQFRYQINHRRNDRLPRPDFQNILYADGHVTGQGRAYYPEPLNTSNNYSLRHAASPVGGFLYWGRSTAGAVNIDPVPPPPAPKPPAPTPAPPTTKPAPAPAPPPKLPKPIP